MPYCIVNLVLEVTNRTLLGNLNHYHEPKKYAFINNDKITINPLYKHTVSLSSVYEN